VRQQVGETVYLPDANVLHIKGLGFDGYTGYNVVHYHKEAIGYGQAVKEYGARFFSGNANPDGILEHPETLSKEAAERLADSWNKNYGGLSKAHRIAVLEEGMKWTKIGVEPEKAQAIEIQKYTVDDCARIFLIPPHKLASMEHSTFSKIEEQNIDFVTSTMLYWFRKWEQECNYKLFLPSEQATMFCEILADALLRGDTKSRYEAFNIGRMGGWLSVNDIRQWENLNPIGPEGDIYLEPLNMKPAGTETPQPEPPSPEPDNQDDARQAHRAMIASQWSRIIKGTNGGGLGKKRDWAGRLLYEPVYAYASMRGRTDVQTRATIETVLDDIIQQNTKLNKGDAENLADKIMEAIQNAI